MEVIKINLKNCYGIGKLEHTFDFSKSNTFLVYAPNGTMKTSLAKTMMFFADRMIEPPCDRLYPEKTAVYELFVDNDETKSDVKILVVDPETLDYDTSDKISSFVASRDLKKKYDEIYAELDLQKSEFIKKLKKVSQSADCESEFINTFRLKDSDTFFDLLDLIIAELDDESDSYEFKYNDIFDKKKNVKKFLDKNEGNLENYISNYKTLLSQSKFFSDSANSFGTYQANAILKSIEDNAFFEAGHALDLSGGGIKISSSEELQELVQSEIENIVNDKSLKDIFDKVDKAIGANAELRAFKKAIEINNLLLLELKDYEAFRKKVWVSYFKILEEDASSLHSYFTAQKKQLKEIFDQAKAEVKIWRELISTFNSRFYVPFDVVLKNQEDVILKEEGANLTFLYKDSELTPVECDKTSLLNTLSKGEQKAFYILQLLFDVESRKDDASDTLIVFDDIADSFDYKNKYAIIEYINDLHRADGFRIIILTHNFDFYRTVASRLYLNRGVAVLMSSKSTNNDLTLLRGQYVKDVFEHLSSRIQQRKVFITLLPFLRNLVTYIGNHNGTDYELLTKCLHLKADSRSILANDVISIWRNSIGRYQDINFDFGDSCFIDMVYEEADSILKEGSGADEIILENKVILSIAIRLKAEEFMTRSLSGVDLNQIETNQTSALFKLYKESINDTGNAVQILDKVILMTPENIHLNAFMYEPLIDMSVWHLGQLYNSVRELN